MKTDLQKVAIIGAGNFARHLLDIFEACNTVEPTYDVLGYVVKPEYGKPGTLINERPILDSLDWLADNRDTVQAICGISAPDVRFRIVEQLKSVGVQFCQAIHPSVIVARWVDIGEGSAIGAGCVLANRVRIGNHVHINMSCPIGHNVVFEDYVTLTPGVNVAGNVKLETGCYVGMGANIIHERSVGAWSTVGSGSVIIEDVPRNSTIVGVPGRVIKMKSDGWHLPQESDKGSRCD